MHFTGFWKGCIKFMRYGLLGTIIYVLLLLLLLCILINRHKIVEVILPELLAKNKILCVLIIAAGCLILVYDMYGERLGLHTMDFIIHLMLILCAVIIVLYLVLFSIYQQIKSENTLKQTAYDNLKIQYYGLKEMYETNSRFMHDMKHELIYIGGCLEDNNISGACESLKGYLQEITKAERKVWTGFSFLDFLLNYKKTEIDKKNIDFILDIELHQIVISEDDLVIILGNLLDNAIEAAQKCEKSQRYIKLKIHNINSMLLLNIENSSSELPQLKNGIFVTSKNDKAAHGFGIESVKQIVKLYDGEIHFQYTENSFAVRILM